MSPEVAVEQTADGVCYRLPIRRWPSQWSGWVLLVMGIVMVAVAIGLLTLVQGQSFWPRGMVLMSVSAIAGLFGALMCIWGHNVLHGRAEIVLRGEQIFGRELTGRLSWTRRQPTANLKRILVLHEWRDAANGANRSSELADIAYRLVLEHEGGRRSVIVKWYARDVLEPVAQDLAQRLGLAEPVDVDDVPEKSTEEEPASQPEGSMIVIEPTADGLTVVIPPLGIVRSPDGRSVTGVLGGGLAGASAGVVTMVLFGVGPWWMWVMFTFPAILGVLTVAAGLLGQRDTFIDIVGDAILISTKGWFGVRQHQWQTEELQDITLGESAVEINDESLAQLHIIPKHGDTVRLLTGRHRDEINWLAHELRQALDLPVAAAEQQ